MTLASSFRARLLSVAGVTALGFALIFGVSIFVNRRVDKQLAFIQSHYMPRLVLQPKLEAGLERIQRGFQDAVAAHDLEALEGTADLKAEFLRGLDGAGQAVDPAAADALRRSLEDYWTLAYDVSRRLIAGETGEGLPAAIAMMQSRQAAVAALVDRTASVDPGELGAAFAATAAAESEAKNYRLWVSVLSFGFVLLVVLGLMRGLVRSVSSLATGFASLGRGEFGVRIPVVGEDEFARLARDANVMAESLETLDADRDPRRRRVRGELPRVAHQVLEQGAQETCVALRDDALGPHELHLAAGVSRPELAGHRLGDEPEVDRLPPELGAGDPRQRQERVDEVSHSLRRRHDAVEVVTRLGREVRAVVLEERGGVPVDPAEGGAQVVRDRVAERLELAVRALEGDLDTPSL
ncbi:MAG TPA: HAMP domain-containing protein, partial [Polyangiaceae bacterium]